MKTIECKTLGEGWIKAMELIINEGEDFYDDDVKLKEIRNLYFTFDSIEMDPIIKKYADADRIELMMKKYHTCGCVGDYKIDYGSYIYNNNGVDQVEWVLNRIKNKPETKSATIAFHIPGEEKLTCITCMDFKLRNGLLEASAVYHGQNIFSSLPGNLIALRSIQDYIANGLNVKSGKFELVDFSAHIYERDYEKTKNVLERYKNEN